MRLLERIIELSCPDDGIVLDAFAGCGTSITAAQKLNRQWIGIDVTHLAIALIKYRLTDAFKLKERKDYQVVGEPTSTEEANALALQDRDEFQKWAVGLVERARPSQDKKGADRGMDGILFFHDDNKEAKKAVIQVKSGKLGVSLIRDFAHVVSREKAIMGLFISLEEPTKPMLLEASGFGFYESPLSSKPIPRIQIRTVKQLLDDEGFTVPNAAVYSGIKKAGKVVKEEFQAGMEF